MVGNSGVLKPQYHTEMNRTLINYRLEIILYTHSLDYYFLFNIALITLWGHSC